MGAGAYGGGGTAPRIHRRSCSFDPPARRSARAAPLAQLTVGQGAAPFTPLSLPPEVDFTQIWRADPETCVASLSPESMRRTKRTGTAVPTHGAPTW